ncbi:molybdopterin-dependent oxidoreductase [Peribacillus muralis]|uniref:molybdopterin-dependent oxidoreductase n=1 Tax=Peribacillus muralis TaxID=264697 RepID=UPI0031F3FC7A
MIKRWKKKTRGKKLISLHHSNASVFLVLTITGLLLYLPALRPILLQVRVWVKDIHIYIGLLSIFILMLYMPLFTKHFQQLVKKKGPIVNLLFVLLTLVGLLMTGVILWLQRYFTSDLSSLSLILHDFLTWVLVPYAIYHSITRSKTIKKAERNPIKEPYVIDKTNPILGRRSFIRMLVGTGVTISIAPFFLKWFMETFTVKDLPTYGKKIAMENKMVPAPHPAPESLQPIGGGARGEFRPYTVTEVPTSSSDDWNFVIDGLVGKKLTYNWKQFLDIPRTVQVSDFHCVTGWSVESVTWEGILLKDFLNMAGVNNRAKFVKFYSGDGVYTDSLSLTESMMEDVMVAVLLDGKPITAEYGGPVRLVVPKMYAYKSVKWLNRIELIEEDHTGFWEQRGYDKNAWVNKTSM